MPIRIHIDSRVRLDRRVLSDPLVAELQEAFTYANPEHALKRAIGITTWGVPRTIESWREKNDVLSFPRGGYRRIVEILERGGHAFIVRDVRHEGGPCPRFPRYVGPPLRPFQEAAIEAAIAKQNCVVRAPTGCGKSLLAIAYAARLGLNTLVILPTVALFKQWCGDALASLAMRKSDLGIIHGSKRVLRPLTVAVQASLASRGIDEELRAFFGVIIVDEVQKAAARTYSAVVDPFPAKYRLGVSADERRQDKKEFLTRDLFADVAFEVKRGALEEAGHILDVEIRVVPTAFKAPWYGVASEGKDDGKEGVNFVRLLAEMQASPERNALVVEHALREVEGGAQAIVLTHQREHCQVFARALVERGAPSGFFIGGADYAREFEATREGITSGALRIGVGTYGALGVGINLPSVEAGIAATPIGGNRQNFNQVRGRLCRNARGKKGARLYVLWDRAVYPKHLDNMIAWNPTVRVLERGRWVDARDYAKRARHHRES